MAEQGIGRAAVLALVGALREEVGDLRRGMAARQIVVGHGWRMFDGECGDKEVLLVQTGPGREQVVGATEFVLRRFPVTGLISFGFAGGLIEDLRVGDVAVCRKLYCADNPETFEPCYSDSSLLALATQVLQGEAIRFVVGNSVTASKLIATPDERRSLGKLFDAVTVDMESFWAARTALSRQVPFLAVRAISDDSGASLPPFDRFFGRKGEWLRAKAILYFLLHPGELGALPSLYLNARRARRNLTRFVGAFLQRL